MSYKHYNEAVDAELPFDSGIQRFIFLESCYRSDNRGIIRSPQAQLASCFLISRQTIAREFVRLQELGLLEKTDYGRYCVCLPGVEKANANYQPAKRKPQSLKNWIVDEFGKESLERGVIEVFGPISELPEFVVDAIKQGVLERVGMAINADEELGYTYHFESSKLN